MIIKHQGIHEGVFSLKMNFNFATGMLTPKEGEEHFSGIMFGVSGIGIEETHADNGYSVDVSKVNPKTKTKRASKKTV